MRKRIITIAIIVLLCLLPGTSTVAIASSDSQNSQIDYEELFSSIDNADGARSEIVAQNLCEAFDANREMFISQLALFDSEKVEEVAWLLVYGKSYTGIYEFKNEMIAMQAEVAFAYNEQQVVNSIVDGINLYIANNYTVEVNSAEINSPTVPAFNAKTILRFIELNEETGNFDEEYFHTLGNAFRADPEYFADVIDELPAGVVNSVTEAVAYDCVKYSYTIDEELISLSTSESVVTKIIDKIAALSLEKTVSSTDTSITALGQNQVYVPMSLVVPTIGNISYTTGNLDIGENEAIRVTINETSATTSERTYWVELHIVRNNVSYLKAGQNITMSAGTTAKNVLFTTSFSELGPVSTVIKVYSQRNGTLLASKQKTASDIVYGAWDIMVALPANRNYKGTLAIYNANGTLQMSCECLGKSWRGLDMMTEYGHTPTGIYTGYLSYTSGSAASYGPYQVVIMNGVSGIIVDSGRTDIWIHGGSAENDPTALAYPLRATEGCVRVSDTDQQSIQNNLLALTSSTGYHYTSGNIEIFES